MSIAWKIAEYYHTVKMQEKRERKKEARAFLELCAGAASFQKNVMPSWINDATRYVRTDLNRIRIPLPIKVDEVFTTAEFPSPFNSAFDVEEIELERWGWLWHSAPDGRRGYTLKLGFAKEANVIAYQKPKPYFIYSRTRAS